MSKPNKIPSGLTFHTERFIAPETNTVPSKLTTMEISFTELISSLKSKYDRMAVMAGELYANIVATAAPLN